MDGPEALNLHQGFHRLLIAKQAAKRLVVDIHEEGRLTPLRKKRRACARHGDVEDFRRVNLPHDAPLVGQDGQEADELPDLPLRIRLIHAQTRRIVGNLPQ